MVIVTIVVADLQRKTERKGQAGILIGVGRNVRSMTQRYEGHSLPRRYFMSSLFRR
jgi:hypothetical protein